MKERESNIELLRALLAFMVIVLHFNNATMPGGGGASALLVPGTARFFWMQFTESLCCCAVNIFILISGYFMIEKKWVDPGHVMLLFIKVVIYNAVLYAVCCILKLEPFDLRTGFFRTIPTNYFIILYSVVYVFAPFVNALIDRLPARKFDILVLMLLCAFVLEPTVVNYFQDLMHVSLVGVSTYAMQGDDAGYTIVHFLVLYIIGGYIKKRDVVGSVRKRVNGRIKPRNIFILVYILTALLIELLSVVFVTTFGYNNLFVVIESLALFMAFLSIKLPRQDWINRLGGYSLDIFLIHTNSLLMTYFWSRFHIADNYAGMPVSKLVPFSAITLFSMYVLCLMIAFLYRVLLEGRIKKIILKKQHFIDAG